MGAADQATCEAWEPAGRTFDAVIAAQSWLPTTGGLTRLPPDATATILDAVGTAIDRLGGRFTMHYTTLATTAVRTGPHSVAG